MTLLSQPWEAGLLLAAQEALASPHLRAVLHIDETALDAVYRHCEVLTAQHSKTFHMASSLLPAEKRKAARALYAFCRVTDDIVDEPQTSLEERQAQLAAWQTQLMAQHCNQHDPVCLAWTDTQIKFNIPHGYAQQLIDGCARDIQQNRYATFADLAEYSYGVASTVGLMAMHIIGFEGEEALPYAVRLGVALQLTNILRDIAEDWGNGRLYLPQDELAYYGLSEADIERGVVTDNWRAFMKYQIERNRRLYDESIIGIAMLNPDGRFAIAAAAQLYRAILDDIEARDYDVFSGRARVSTWGKVRRLPRIWWQSRQG